MSQWIVIILVKFITWEPTKFVIIELVEWKIGNEQVKKERIE